MKKVLFSLLALSALSASAAEKVDFKRENSVFKKGDKVLALGVAPVSGLGVPVNLSFELGVKDKLGPGNLGIGGLVGVASRNYKGGINYSVLSIVVAVRGMYHYQFVDKLDTYGGVVAGWNAASANYPSTWIGAKTTYGGPVAGGFVGARYYFAPKFAGMLEVGAGGLGYVNAGLAVKF